MKRLVLLRRCSQVFFFGFFVYVLWSSTYPLSGGISPKLLFQFDPLVMLMTALSERLFIRGLVFSFVMLGLTLIVGRFFCGWVCPLGCALDAIAKLKRRQQTQGTLPVLLRSVKYAALASILIFAVLGVQVAWVFDPLVIIARVVSLNIIPSVTFLIDRLFISIVKTTEFYEPIYDFYRSLRLMFLGVKTSYFSHAGFVFGFFLLIGMLSLINRRYWCRNLCPLGALYALIGRFSLLERFVKHCSACKRCVSLCRMGAIEDTSAYRKEECILCMDCIYDCPEHLTQFKWQLRSKKNLLIEQKNALRTNGITRREFLSCIGIPLFLSALMKFSRGRNRIFSFQLLRPPAALEEEHFLNACIRCGNCMKVCPTNTLQPVLLQAGLEGLWTPHLVAAIGWCEYNCRLCSSVCPTGAIANMPLEQKQKTPIGIAHIDRQRCLPWKEKKQCIVCEEHCPVPDKAIRLKKEVIEGVTLLRPEVDEKLCIGCAICETKCPTRPERSIWVSAQGAKRTSVNYLLR